MEIPDCIKIFDKIKVKIKKNYFLGNLTIFKTLYCLFWTIFVYKQNRQLIL